MSQVASEQIFTVHSINFIPGHNVPVECTSTHETIRFEPIGYEVPRGKPFRCVLVGCIDQGENFYAVYRIGDYFYALDKRVTMRYFKCAPCDKYYYPSETHSCDKYLSQKYKTEFARVIYHNKRAETYNLPATLTITQWIQTLRQFEWKCAYCKGKYTVVEHFVPLGYDKGTTWENCVPACHSCNGIKGPYHPDAIPPKEKKKIGMALLAVQQYLHTRRNEVEA